MSAPPGYRQVQCTCGTRLLLDTSCGAVKFLHRAFAHDVKPPSPTHTHSPDHIHMDTPQCEGTGEHDSVAVQKTENMTYLRLAGEQMSVASLYMILTSAIQPESFW